jgi:predicted O-methyltransferase YrrM
MRLHALRAYWQHLWRARRPGRGSHAFLQQLYREALRPRTSLPEAAHIDLLRRKLTHSRVSLPIQDHGAGPANQGGGLKHVPLGRMARRAACPRAKGERLLRLTRFLQPARMLELGTHLGFSALYQLTGAPQASLITLEGAGSLAYLAQQHLNRFDLEADIRLGTFEQSLKALDLSAYQPDYVYLDGDHRYAPTLHYFDHIAPHVPDGGLMVLDDIYWSEEMTEVWRVLCARAEVTLSLDLYHLGLCFLRRPEPKSHRIIR